MMSRGDKPPQAHQQDLGDVEDIDRLFGDIDWPTANFTALEAQWRAELAAIEKDNVGALLESSERGQSVLPAINGAIGEVARVEGLFVDYNRQLKMMGREISQIAEINKVLDVQAQNQAALLAELAKILKSVSVPGELVQILTKPTFEQQQLNAVQMAAEAVYAVLATKFDRGIREVRAVGERMQQYRALMDGFEGALLQALVGDGLRVRSSGHKHGDQLAVLHAGLQPYAPLIRLLAVHAPQKFMTFRMAYESYARGLLTREMAEAAELLKAHHLLTKTPDEKPSFLLSSNRPSSSLEPLRFSRGTSFAGHVAFGSVPLAELGSGDRLLPEQLFEYMLLRAVQASSTAHDQIQAIFPTDLSDRILDAIFSGMQDLLITTIAEPLIRADRLSSFAFLGVVERRLPEMGVAPAMETALKLLQTHCTTTATEYIRTQVEAIQETRLSAKKRTGIFPFVAIFPKFVTVLERAIEGAAPGGLARSAATHAYNALSTAIFACLNGLAVQAGQTEDEKDNLNASIMTVQNTFYLLEIMTSMNNPAIEPILRQAKAEFDENNAGYARLSLGRVLGRIPDFFEPIRRLLQSSPQSPEEVSFHASYDRSAARRFLASLSPRDLRKNVEAIRERVLKHFKGGSKDDIVVSLVWKGLQALACQRIQDYVDIIYQVYPGTDIALPISIEDLNLWFNEAAKIN